MGVRDLQQQAEQLTNDAYALFIAARDPRTPARAKIFGLVVAAYILSPIDLLPDFIPFVGFLDELLILPFAYRIMKSMIPENVMDDARARADIFKSGIRKIKIIIISIIVSLLVMALAALVLLVLGAVYLFQRLF